MATYSPIANSEVAPGAAASSSLFNRLRDNPIAISEGASGAPRIVVPGALSTTETDTTKVLTPNGAGGTTWSNFNLDPKYNYGAGGETSLNVFLTSGNLWEFAGRVFAPASQYDASFHGVFSRLYGTFIEVTSCTVNTTNACTLLSGVNVTFFSTDPNGENRLEWVGASNVLRFRNISNTAFSVPCFLRAFRLN